MLDNKIQESKLTRQVLISKISSLFPNDIDPQIISAWLNCSDDLLVSRLLQTFNKMPSIESCLRLIKRITIPQEQESFYVGDKFKKNQIIRNKIKIFVVIKPSDLQFNDLVELPRTKQINLLSYAIINEKIRIKTLLNELGGWLGDWKKALVNFSDIYKLMELHENTEEELVLSTNRANIFFVELNKQLYWLALFTVLDSNWWVLCRSIDTEIHNVIPGRVFIQSPMIP